jgi:fatty acid desaturase
MVPDSNDDFRNARTTKAGLVMRALVAPYWVNYHVEHHLMMWVPCYNLPKTRAFLIANGFGPRIETKESYAEVLRMATSKPDDQDKRGNLVHNARRQRVEGTMAEGFKPSDEAA